MLLGSMPGTLLSKVLPKMLKEHLPTMLANLSVCGGILTMTAGFRVSHIKSVSLVDLMTALILVMSVYALDRR